jgi:hypothetical protein
MLSRLNNREPSPAEVIDLSGQGFWAGTYIEVGEGLSWKDPKRWTIFYGVVDRGTGAGGGFVRTFHATDRADAVIQLSRAYPGCVLMLDAVLGPLTPDEVREIERVNAKLYSERGQRPRDLGTRPSDTGQSRVSAKHRGNVPVGV